MKARLVIVLLVLLSLSCDQGVVPDDPEINNLSGEVAFSLAKSVIPTEVRVIVAILERSKYQTIKDSVSVFTNIDTVKLRVINVPAGTWSLTIHAQDKDGRVLYSGNSPVTVSGGQATQVLVQMIPAGSDLGIVEIQVVWPKIDFKWIMSPLNPIVQQTPGSPDSQHFFFIDPTVLKVGGVYRMWYTTGLSLSVNGVERNWIAYATSTDGTHWTKHGEVVNPGTLGSWNDKGSVNPAVIYDGGIYKMWFEGIFGTKYHNAIGYAESNDGFTWRVNAEPVFRSNTTRPEFWTPCVIKRNNLYYLFMGIGGIAGSKIDIFLYTSTNAQTWTDRGKVLSARPEVFWEKRGITAPNVIYDQEKFRMFYTGFGDDLASIGYAESSDGIAWTRYGTTPALSTSNTFPWVTSWVAYPSIMKEGDKLKIWFSGLARQPYRWQTGYAEHLE